MVKIKEKDGKMIFYDFEQGNEGVEFVFDDYDFMSALAIFENAIDKLNRYMRNKIGWEHVQWIGTHTIIPDEVKEEGIEFLKGLKKEIDIKVFDLLVKSGHKKEEERDEYLKKYQTKICEGLDKPAE